MAANTEQVLRFALCPNILFGDKLKEFIAQRAATLKSAAELLCL
jgi:hypothetical protein